MFNGTKGWVNIEISMSMRYLYQIARYRYDTIAATLPLITSPG